MKQDSYVTSASLLARVSDNTQSQGGADEYVIRHGGAFYRPNAQGYTYSLAEAWRLPKEEAEKYINNDPYHTVTIQSVGELVERVDHELEAASAKVNALLNMKAALQPRVSDGSPEGVKTEAGLIEDDSAVGNAETPHPSPVDYTEVVEKAAKSLARMVIEYVEGGILSNQNWRNGLDAVIERRLQRLLRPVIEAQAAEIERLKAVSADYHKSYLVMWPALNSRAMPLGGDNSVLTARLVERLDREQARIAELEKERDEARKGMNTFFNLGQEAGRRADAAEARLADAVKALGWIVSNPGAHSANMVTVADNALQTLSTGGDSHG